jgi:hypothetical protein
MNYLKIPGLSLLFILLCAIVNAQDKIPLNEPDNNKPKLFTHLPDQIPVTINELKSFISGNAETGKQVQLNSSDNKIPGFSGKIVSHASKYQNRMNSVVVRLNDFNEATLTLSSSTQPDGTVLYTGRIISFKSGDLYELQKKDDQYFLTKKNYYELVNE